MRKNAIWKVCLTYLKCFLVSIAVVLTFTLPSCSNDDKVDGGEAPEIYITSPESEGVYVTINNTIKITGVASDDKGLSSITWTNNNGKPERAEGLENWTINNAQLVDGENKIIVTATDIGGQKVESEIIIQKNKYINYLGMPKMDPPAFFSESETEVHITATVIGGDNFIESSVKLIEVDEDGNYVKDICDLYDNGNLDTNGDEIKSDNVFSAKHSFNITDPGKKYYRVTAASDIQGQEITDSSPILTLQVIDKNDAESIAESLFKLHQKIEEKLKTLENNSDKQAVAKEMLEFIKTQPEVKSAKIEGDYIAIEHISGLISYVYIESGTDNKGGGSGKRGSKPTLPLSQQTRGTLDNFKSLKAASDEDIIQNKNVLIWAPYEDEFNISMEPVLRPVFEASELDLSITYVRNNECTVSSLKDITKYGIVVFDTHGAGGDLLLTKEKQTAKPSFDILLGLISKKIIVVTMASGTYYGVSAKFFSSDVPGFFPNSVVFNGSCESTKTNLLEKAIIGKGAKTYLGFSENVLTSFCNNKSVEFFTALTGSDLKTTGESFVADSYITSSNLTCYYQMKGSTIMRFTLSLINGDFEYGNLHGWQQNGDGRVITKLSNLIPTQEQFMGIISTGLGYTTEYGSISQTFKVTNETKLSLKWNFLSEEFLEYVGSIYQDYLKITMTAKDGTSEVLYMNAIDGFNKDFPLVIVSPSIVFDKGGVYMTGWQSSVFDISKFQGKVVTLKIESGDVGDSIFDSATLLDEIKVYKE